MKPLALALALALLAAPHCLPVFSESAWAAPANAAAPAPQARQKPLVYSTGLKKQAQDGDREAQLKLGLCYYGGLGTKRDFKEAAWWFYESGKRGNVEAIYRLGLCYRNGEGVATSSDEAQRMFRMAAKKGHAEAYNELGLYYAGPAVPFDKDFASAFPYWKEGAERGSADAQCNLATCYYAGTGVAKDYAKAVEWAQRASEQEHGGAQNLLAMCYHYGHGVEQDDAKAKELLLRGAKNKNTYARHNLKKWFGITFESDRARRRGQSSQEGSAYIGRQ